MKVTDFTYYILKILSQAYTFVSKHEFYIHAQNLTEPKWTPKPAIFSCDETLTR